MGIIILFFVLLSIFQNFHNNHCLLKGGFSIPLCILQACGETLNLNYNVYVESCTNLPPFCQMLHSSPSLLLFHTPFSLPPSLSCPHQAFPFFALSLSPFPPGSALALLLSLGALLSCDGSQSQQLADPDLKLG